MLSSRITNENKERNYNMKRDFKEALAHRRSHYGISDKSSISDSEIENMIEFALVNVPSAFNSQSTRIVLLIGKEHHKLWSITKETLKAMLPSKVFGKTEEKIDGSFACGHGTVLFFEDQSVVKGLEESFPIYKDNFQPWSWQTSAMHQLAVWTMLEDAGLGASLQHYNPIIDKAVHEAWNIPENWKLIAEMPFGAPTDKMEDKEIKPLKDRLKVYKS